jgi:endonuclease/exonuclease/phosphatase family metal-dependent hydrolase
MLHGFPRFEHLDERLQLIAAELRRTDPDLVLLQEVPWRPGLGTAASYLAEELQLNHVYLRANGNRWAILFEEGEAILSRHPLRDVGFVELAPRAGFFEHRVALRATVAAPGEEVSVVVTHLTHGDSQMNRAQTRALSRFVAADTRQSPTIVAGDFNAEDSSLQIVELGWIDAGRESGPSGAGRTCCVDAVNAGPGEPLETRIDYIFLAVDLNRSAAVVAVQPVCAQPRRIDGTWLWCSDHVGLLATFSLSGAEGR